MCLAIYSHGETLSVDEYRAAYESNPHGVGYAFSDGSAIYSDKGVWSFEELREHIDIFKGYPHILHFRFATHGANNANNCHPFLMTGYDHDFFMIHNGILSWRSTKNHSDTSCFVHDFMRHNIDSLFEDMEFQCSLESIIGANKLVFLRDDGEFRILNEHMGHWLDNGSMWLSNHSYVPYTFKPLGKAVGKTKMKPIQIRVSDSTRSEEDFYDCWTKYVNEDDNDDYDNRCGF